MQTKAEDILTTVYCLQQLPNEDVKNIKFLIAGMILASDKVEKPYKLVLENKEFVWKERWEYWIE